MVFPAVLSAKTTLILPKSKLGIIDDDLDHVVQFISARPDLYERFANATIAAAKRHIPTGLRREYILD
jgi:hypothetical protein